MGGNANETNSTGIGGNTGNNKGHSRTYPQSLLIRFGYFKSEIVSECKKTDVFIAIVFRCSCSNLLVFICYLCTLKKQK